MSFSIIQTKSALTTTSITWTSNTTTGNTIVVGFISNNPGPIISSVTDSQGNTYTRAFTQTGLSQAPGIHCIEFWYSINITGGTTPTITPTFIYNGAITLIREYSGISAIDKIANTNGSGNSLDSGNTATTSFADELVVGLGGQELAATHGWTAGSGFGNLYNSATSGNNSIAIEDKSVSSTGAYNAMFTAINSPLWAAGVVTFVGITPTVTTQAVTNNTATLGSATGNGNVTAGGGSTITERGTVINTTGTPTTSDTKFNTSGTTGAFTTSMTGLIPGTLYYLRAYAINGAGTSYGSQVTFTAVNFLNPTYAYADDANYCTAGADSGVINVQLSGDAGSTWSSTLSKTYTGSETEQTFGTGTTELWGASWLGSNVSDTNFRLRVSLGTRADTHKWQTFGFAPGSSVVLTGISVKIKAFWTSATSITSIGHISAEILYGTSTVPVAAGSVAYGSDASTSGALEVYNGSAWKELVDTSTAQNITNKTTTTQSPADNSTNLATTAYVDNAVLGQNFKEAVRVATTATLVGTYSNGASGVGATFIYTATGTDSIDGVTLALNDRVLLKNQTSDFQNGIYKVTTAGAVGVAGILTRATDADQTTDFKTGDSVFVTAGTVGISSTWAYTGIDSPTMGTTSLTYAQTAGSPLTIMQTIYPVGAIYISTLSTNPNTLLGFGTWSAYAAGRVLVGVGTSDQAFAAAATGGESNHTLTSAESGVPAHGHLIRTGDNNYNVGYGGAVDGAGNGMRRNVASGDIIAAINNTTANASSAHNNLQPYVVVYMWSRSA